MVSNWSTNEQRLNSKKDLGESLKKLLLYNKRRKICSIIVIQVVIGVNVLTIFRD